MNGIELSVLRIARVEDEREEAGIEMGVGHELREYVTEFDVGRKLPGRFIQNVERAALIVDEKAEADNGASEGSERKEFTRPNDCL